MPSTAIDHISYNEVTQELHVTFMGGGAYTYYEVPKAVYAAFRAAASKGQFFNGFIKEAPVAVFQMRAALSQLPITSCLPVLEKCTDETADCGEKDINCLPAAASHK